MDELESAASQPGESASPDRTGAHAAGESEPGAVVSLAAPRSDWDWGDAPPGAEAERSWRQEVPRWLATLDAPSTRREYEKAVRYFFETAGVPQALSELTYDLLIAYRGSLARRAERGATRPSAQGRPVTAPGLAAARAAAPALPAPDPTGDEATADEPSEDGAGSRDAASRTGPLAPATANLRITALRRFLLHCVLWDLVPRLTSDRIAAALRRLHIERRRPYQVLAEPEWEAFLAAARRPVGSVSARETDYEVDDQLPGAGDIPPADAGDRSPWGTPRAIRRRLVNGAQAEQTDPAPHTTTTMRPGAASLRSRAGLTGARTARRDHALLALALATGLRAIELCALDVADLRREWHAGREEWWLILPDEKTKGQRGGRTLPLGPDLARTLLDYLAASERRWERPQDRTSPLFLSNRHQSARGIDQVRGASSRRLSTAQVRRIVDRVEAQWSAESGGELPEGAGGVAAPRGTGRAISPHALRHSTAVALLEGNEATGRPPASVEHVRGWLGHFDIRTTQGYLAHVDSRRHRRPFALDPVRPDPATGPHESEQ